VVLQRLAACRGALGGLLVEILDGHLRQHIVDPDKRPRSPQTDAAEELIGVIRSYLR
jgi:FrmR/RcnR family transcriptional regulator, repressor of frmRAB operon